MTARDPDRPRVAVASSGLGHVARGVEAWATDLAAALHARGANITLYKGGGSADRPYEVVLPCRQRGETATQELVARVPRWLGWRVGLGSAYGVEQTTFARHLVRHLRRTRADVLHVQDPQVADLVRRARRVGLVRAHTVLAHGTEESPGFLRRFRYVQHLAPWHLEQARAAGAWRETWTAIPNFVDTDLFRPGRAEAMRAELGLPAGALVVVTSAAVKRDHKRIDHLLAEFAELRRRRPDLPAYLVVAGGREAETDELVAEGERLLGDRVRFRVRFPRERMPELLRAADLFVLASLFEMMPIALLEAAASGLPCLTHGHPVMGWMTGPGGRAVDMAAPGALAAALADLLTDPAGRAAMGAVARAHCVAEFGAAAVVNQVEQYYARVRADGRGVAA